MFSILILKHFRALIICLSFLFYGCETIPNKPKTESIEETGKDDLVKKRIKGGDIIFHKSKSTQSRLISKVTGSDYTHMGILFYDNGKLYVYEAVGPVKSTPFKEWVARGSGGRYVVKRLREADRILTPDNLSRLKKAGLAYRGKPYDLMFRFSNEEIYCSELVYKMYKDALGISVGELGKFSDFDLSDPEVKNELKRRYKGEYSLTEPIISPESMFHSPLLETVEDNW